jgi:YHS domain-containing protein
MLKNITLGLIICGVVLTANGTLWAGIGTKDAGINAALEIGNKICPVSGEKTNEETKAIYEYKGKIYNLCCAACIEEFRNNPEKYVQIIEKEK